MAKTTTKPSNELENPEELKENEVNNNQEKENAKNTDNIENPRENDKETKSNKANKPKEKIYTVYTPVKNYVGEIAGVQFAYGKAEVKEGWILNWFKEKGYKVEEK